MARRQNHELERMLKRAGWSHSGLAKRVNEGCAARGIPRSYTATSVANWLAGMSPAEPVPAVLIEAFAARLRIAVSDEDLGLLKKDVPASLGMQWVPDSTSALVVTRKLWRADKSGLLVDAAAGWSSALFAEPVREWLIGWPDDTRPPGRGPAVTAADVDVLWDMCRAFADADHRMGGGYARSTLVHYADEVALGLTDGTYDGEVGRQLLAAIARLNNLAAFMTFDVNSPGLAQRYYIQALRLAGMANDRTLGAHILGDMAMQASHQGDPREARSLARAGQQTAKEVGARAIFARCCAMEARALARIQDRAGCLSAMGRAERALDQSAAGNDPTYARFFTHEQLYAELVYAGVDLEDDDIVKRHSEAVLTSTVAGMERRRLLVGATVAAYVLERRRSPDVGHACEILGTTVPLVRAVKSNRATSVLSGVLTALKPYRHMDEVQEVEQALTTSLAPAA